MTEDDGPGSDDPTLAGEDTKETASNPGTGRQRTAWPGDGTSDPDVALPPSWAFGVLYGTYEDQAGATQKVRDLLEGDFPIDALWIDSSFWDETTAGPEGYLDFEGDREGYPDPEGLWATLRELDVKSGIWAWDRLNDTEDHYEEFEREGYYRDYLTDNDWHNEDARATSGIVDFGNPEAAARWKDLMGPLVEAGVDFFKIDASPVTPYVRTHFELSQESPRSAGRGFLLSHTREDIGYHTGADTEGSAERFYDSIKRYPTCWTGDSVPDWELRDTEKDWLSGGFEETIRYYADPEHPASDTPFLTNDTGGFARWVQAADGMEELYARWTQFSAFGPIMEVFATMYSDHQNAPYEFSELAQDVFRRYSHLRMQLFPYVYSYAHRTRHESRLMVQGTADSPTQYRFGEEFYVAPVHEDGAREWNVHLPEGRWRDYWTGDVYDGDRTVTVDAPLERLPLFVRAGAVIPMREYARAIERGSNDPLILDVYPDHDASFTLYEDDGRSEAYRGGRFATTDLGVETGDDLRVTVGASEGDYEGKLDERSYEIRVHDVGEPGTVRVGDAELLRADVDEPGTWSHDGDVLTARVHRPTDVAFVVELV